MLDHLRRLNAHGVWADARLLAAAQAAGGDLTPVLRELAHVRGAQETWLSRIEGRAATLPVWPSLTLSELARVGTAVDAQLTQALSSLTPSRLAAEVRYANAAGQIFHLPAGDIILHLMLHGQYHRARANAALREIGAAAMNVDFIVWQRAGGPEPGVSLPETSTAGGRSDRPQAT